MSSNGETKKGKKGKKAKKDTNLVDISSLPLPAGWEKKFSKEKNKPYYIDHNTRDTYWRHPLDPKFKPKKPKTDEPPQEKKEEAADGMEDKKEAAADMETEKKDNADEKKEEEKTADAGPKVVGDDKDADAQAQIPLEAVAEVAKDLVETEGVGEEKDTLSAIASDEKEDKKEEEQPAEEPSATAAVVSEMEAEDPAVSVAEGEGETAPDAEADDSEG